MLRNSHKLICATLLLACCVSSTRLTAQVTTKPEDLALTKSATAPQNGIWLESLDLRNMTTGAGSAQAGKSWEGKPITLKGVVYPHGVGTHANSQINIDLKGEAQQFISTIGLDDEVLDKGAVAFQVIVDGRKAYDSGAMRGGDEPRTISVSLTGARRMTLSVTSEGDINGDHADWAGALILMNPNKMVVPQSINMQSEAPARWFPPLPTADVKPVIRGPRVVGVSPNKPFLYLVPTTGKGPLTYSATGLPTGLTLNPKTGIITGRIATAGTYKVELAAKNAQGRATRVLEIVCGEGKRALTPIMGWNAWNVFGDKVTASKVREQADWLIKSGLASYGYNYIIIDDTWQARRDKDGSIAPNRRFGDIKALADYLHSRGLKLGIFSSPNAETCSGFAGSEGYEDRDAATYAKWGVDLLKYDWCDSGKKSDQTADVLKAAYAKMRTALNKTDRDIVYSLTTYGMGNPWEWAPKSDVDANTWTTSAQILDRWDMVRNNGFALSDRSGAASPGHWNDPGLLQLGKIGSDNPHFTRLRPSEQLMQMTLWSLAAAPLIISCDLTQLDPNNYHRITTSLLTHNEVLDINQDPLGKAGKRVEWTPESEVWSRPLSDGTVAVGLFNRGERPQAVNIEWSRLGLNGPQPVRDVWRRSNLGNLNNGYSAIVPRHGAVLIKVGKPQSPTS